MLVDANVLLYAVDEESRFHEAARAWLGDAAPAAICEEHGLTMVSADSDFARFPALAWFKPGGRPLTARPGAGRHGFPAAAGLAVRGGGYAGDVHFPRDVIDLLGVKTWPSPNASGASCMPRSSTGSAPAPPTCCWR